jgi:hypothetical protein
MRSDNRRTPPKICQARSAQTLDKDDPSMPKIHKDEGWHLLRVLGISREGIRAPTSLGHSAQRAKAPGFETSREIKSGLEIQTFATQKASEDWIIQADAWGPLQ